MRALMCDVADVHSRTLWQLPESSSRCPFEAKHRPVFNPPDSCQTELYISLNYQPEIVAVLISGSFRLSGCASTAREADKSSNGELKLNPVYSCMLTGILAGVPSSV